MMAIILSDVEIKKLLDNEIIIEGDEEHIRSNSYVFRLGTEVRFFSTNDRKKGELGNILIINPGDSVLVTSIEEVDFSSDKISKIYKERQLCAFLTPSTTLVREGFQLPSTKIDPGYSGTLNWTIRNSSVEKQEMEMGEPVFKATFFLLTENEEIPEQIYGDKKERDFYQEKTGLVESKRRMPVDRSGIKTICVESEGTELERLKQSGFPYNFIAQQLHQVGQDLEIVTEDFARLDKLFHKLNEKFEKQDVKIEELLEKMDLLTSSIKEQKILFRRYVDESVFRKLVLSWITVFTVVCAIIAGGGWLWEKGLFGWVPPISGFLALLGLVALAILTFITRKKEVES